MAEKTIVEVNHELKNQANSDTLKPHEVREIRDHLKHLHEHKEYEFGPAHDHHDHGPAHKLPEWMRNPLSFIGMVALWTLLWMILFTVFSYVAYALSAKTATTAKIAPVYYNVR